MKFKRNIYFIFTFIFIFSFNFENLQLLTKYGNIMNIGVYNLLPVTVLLYSFFIKKYIKELKMYEKYILYLIVILLLNLIINSEVFMDKNIFIKSIQLIIGIIFQYLTIKVLSNLISKIELSNLKKIINFNILFIMIIFIYELLKNSFVGRIKLLTGEPSESGYLVLIFFLLAFLLNKSKIIRLLLLVMGIFLEIFIGSKGAMLCFCLSLFINTFINNKYQNLLKKLKKGIIMLSCLLVIILLFYNKLEKLIINDLKIYTSIVTRSWSLLTGILIGIKNPFGILGEYIVKFIEVGMEVKKIIQINFPNLNYKEIDSYLFYNAVGGVPKAAFIFNFMIGGLAYLIFQFYWFRTLWKRNKNKTIRFSILLIIISFFSYTQDNFTGTTLLFYSIILSKNKEFNIEL